MQSTAARPPVWLWFSLLSLDAPVIALVWQDFLARCYPTTLLPTGRAVLGLTVWGIYLADRLLDVRHPVCAVETIRHRFYRQHRCFGQILLAIVVCADVIVTSLWLRPAVLNNGLILSAGVVAYLGAFPFTGWNAPAWKKPLAALIFTAGIFLIAWTGPGESASRLAWPAAVFCALCLCNLVMIEKWSRSTENEVLQSHFWIWLLFPAAGLLWTGSAAWFTAVTVSAAGLCALARWGRRISGDARCVLADALLLTPLLFHSAQSGVTVARAFR